MFILATLNIDEGKHNKDMVSSDRANKMENCVKIWDTLKF